MILLENFETRCTFGLDDNVPWELVGSSGEERFYIAGAEHCGTLAWEHWTKVENKIKIFF